MTRSDFPFAISKLSQTETLPNSLLPGIVGPSGSFA